MKGKVEYNCTRPFALYGPLKIGKVKIVHLKIRTFIIYTHSQFMKYVFDLNICFYDLKNYVMSAKLKKKNGKNKETKLENTHTARSITEILF